MSVEFLEGDELVFYNDLHYVINATLGVENESSEPIPDAYRLDCIYPNPFNSTSLIEYSVPVASLISFKLFDLCGRQVRSLFYGSNSPGNHRLTLDAINLPSGAYIITMDAGNFRTSMKVEIIK